MFKGQKGVTLVALVVTIIVLLILAGVSISMVVGQNGILTRTQGSVNNQNAAAAREKISMAISTLEMEYSTTWASNSATTRASVYTADKLKTEIKNNGVAEGDISISGDLLGSTGATVKIQAYTFSEVKVNPTTGALTMSPTVAVDGGESVTLSNI